jgi:hypothetical protein
VFRGERDVAAAQQGAQDQGDDERVVELPGDRDEVGHDVDGIAK